MPPALSWLDDVSVPLIDFENVILAMETEARECMQLTIVQLSLPSVAHNDSRPTQSLGNPRLLYTEARLDPSRPAGCRRENLWVSKARGRPKALPSRFFEACQEALRQRHEHCEVCQDLRVRIARRDEI